MDAERVREAVLVRERSHALEIAPVDRREDDLRDASGAGARDDGVAIGVELSGVEVAVRVDPHACDDACPTGGSLL
jgi:hypothetical protein